MPSQLLAEPKTAHQSYLGRKIIHPDNIIEVLTPYRSQGMTVATLNGSFDLLHAGHLHIIYEASLAADYLLVALNTDRSIQEYKSPSRPIVTLKDRMAMMASLEFVNGVTWFDETTPIDLLDKIKPDVHVNGAEYGTDCIEAETVLRNGGKIKIVPLIPGLSTSNLIKKIKEMDS